MMDIRRGDIFYISGGKTYAGYGRQSDSGRPAIIVSNDAMNKTADYVEVVYLTTQEKKPLPTHCEIICKQKSTAMCETIYTVNKDRVGDYVKSLNECLMNSIGLSYMVDFAEPYDRDYSELQDEIDTLRTQKASLEKQLKDKGDDSAIEVERDLYKKLYEQLLEKVVA